MERALHYATEWVRSFLGTALIPLGQFGVGRRRGPVRLDTENWQPMSQQFVNWSIAVVVVMVVTGILLYWRSRRRK